MNRWIMAASLIAALVMNVGVALAHAKITVGPYTLEVGWVEEPPIVGVKNAAAINIVTTSDGKPVDGVSTLVVTVSMGGQDKQLDMHPLGEATPGQYTADFIPTRRGTYTVKLSGKIESTDVNTSVDIEETVDPTTLQFPGTQPSIGDLQNTINDLSNQVSTARAFGVAGLALAVIALVLAGSQLRKKG
jgi:YtkA-like